MQDWTFRKPVRLDAYALRHIAEEASGRRSDSMVYYLVDHGDEFVLEEHHADERPPTGAVMEIDTHVRQRDRPKVTAVSITAGDTPYSLDRYDAVFWSEAAVEKFVFPYLVSKSMWKAANHLAALSRCWYYGSPPPNVPGEATGNEIPFAIGHIPDSDFIPVEGNELEILFRRADGTVHARSLGDLIAEEEGRGRGTGDPEARTPASPDAG